MADANWWQTFFDSEYLRIWGGFAPDSRTQQEVDGLWQVLGLEPGARILDAPCGYGRLSRPLAERGARVVGVDQSPDLLAAAEERRGDLPAERLRYLRHDLRQPLEGEGGFDAALNVYSSLGYGTEADDAAIVRTLAAAVRPGGKVVVESTHRDAIVAKRAAGHTRSSLRMADGTLVVEEPSWDPVAARVDTVWYYWGPSGPGEKPASMRVYTVSELAGLMAGAGLTVAGLYSGCSPRPFAGDGPNLSWRVAVVGERPIA